MSLRRLDLNLLPVLDALLRHRNVTRAGKELGISQSAMSHSLMRLRAQFSDELLVQSGREMVPSYRAQALAEPLSEILGLVANLIDETPFDPATSSRRFRIGTADHMTFLLLPKFAAMLQGVAPKMSLQVTWDLDQKAAKLRANRLDLAVVSRGTFADVELCCEPLFDDELVVIAAKDNSRIGKSLDFKTFNSLRHVRVKLESTNRMTFADMQLARNQIDTDDAVLVTSFLLLPFFVASSENIALISRRLATHFQQFVPIRLFKPPFPTERIYLDAYWSYSANRDVAHRWIRKRLREQCEMWALEYPLD